MSLSVFYYKIPKRWSHFLPEGYFDQTFNERQSDTRMLIRPIFNPGLAKVNFPYLRQKTSIVLIILVARFVTSLKHILAN